MHVVGRARPSTSKPQPLRAPARPTAGVLQYLGVDLNTLLAVARDYISALNGYLRAHDDSDWDYAESERQRALRALPAAQAVARVIPDAPDPTELDPAVVGGYTSALNGALRLEGAIVVRRDLAAALRDDGPTVSSKQLHQWVSEASAPLWRDGHYRQAVHAAACLIDEHLQAKLGRDDIYGTALAREAFSREEPKPGHPRLRFPWVAKGTDTFRSAHDGARDLGTACAQLIRNTAAHRTGPLSERVAMEQLATLSYWARLIDTAKVLTSAKDPATPEGE